MMLLLLMMIRKPIRVRRSAGYATYAPFTCKSASIIFPFLARPGDRFNLHARFRNAGPDLEGAMAPGSPPVKRGPAATYVLCNVMQCNIDTA